MQYKIYSVHNSVNVFTKKITRINLKYVTSFLQAICYSIFEYLLAVSFKEGEIFGSIFTYFGTIEINGQGMLHLHYFMFLCNAFYISQLRNRMQTNVNTVFSWLSILIQHLMIYYFQT